MPQYIKATTAPTRGNNLINDALTDNAHTWSSEKILDSRLKSKIVSLGNVTINSDGWLGIDGYKPAGMNHFMFCLIHNYGSVSTKDAFNVNCTGDYLQGTANATIYGVELKYFYYD